jgi:uroporphyrinogen-III synthase
MTTGSAIARPSALWVTRPAQDAPELARTLRSRGYAVVVEPLLIIEHHAGPPLDLADVQALLATSANGVRALAARSPDRCLPLLAVGDATARAARLAGFARVESASGDVAALAELAKRRLDPARGVVLHIASSEVAGDLAGTLAAAGFACRRAVLYEARAARSLSQALAASIRGGAVDGVLVFSPRTARTLVRILAAEGLMSAAAGMSVFCLSGNVAGAARELPWRRIVTAAEPTQAALLDAIDL